MGGSPKASHGTTPARCTSTRAASLIAAGRRTCCSATTAHAPGPAAPGSIANWLSEHGYRTKQGKIFNANAVLTILRNRTYLGEIYFRGQYHKAPHQPLVDEALFEHAQHILAERGEDPSSRRSNQSDYLLTCLVRCGHCGKRYLGAAAHGRNARYSYYVCFSRQRYGRRACENDRIPAPQFENAVLVVAPASSLSDDVLI